MFQILSIATVIIVFHSCATLGNNPRTLQQKFFKMARKELPRPSIE